MISISKFTFGVIALIPFLSLAHAGGETGTHGGNEEKIKFKAAVHQAIALIRSEPSDPSNKLFSLPLDEIGSAVDQADIKFEPEVCLNNPCEEHDERLTAVNNGKQVPLTIRVSEPRWTSLDGRPSAQMAVALHEGAGLTGFDYNSALTKTFYLIAEKHSTSEGISNYHVKKLALSDKTSCALMESGKIYCWGAKFGLDLAQFGTLNSDFPEWNKNTLIPTGTVQVVQTSKNGDVPIDIAITKSANQGCTLYSSGRIACWNGVQAITLGDVRDGIPMLEAEDVYSTTYNQSTPVAQRFFSVPDESFVVQDRDGILYGLQVDMHFNEYKQGLPSDFNSYGTLSDSTLFSYGTTHTCRAIPGGEVTCSANEDDGRGLLVLGVSVNSKNLAKYCTSSSSGSGSCSGAIENIRDAKQIAVGLGWSCALTREGTVKCWGNNEIGNLGRFETSESGEPKDVLLQPGSLFKSAVPLTDVVKIAVHRNAACAVTREGQVYCWGGNDVFQLGVPWTRLPDKKQYCAISKISPSCPNGKWTMVKDFDTHPSDHPVLINNLVDPAVDVEMSNDHTCVILKDGKAKCWGLNQWGQLGDGTRHSTHVPVEVKGLAD